MVLFTTCYMGSRSKLAMTRFRIFLLIMSRKTAKPEFGPTFPSRHTSLYAIHLLSIPVLTGSSNTFGVLRVIRPTRIMEIEIWVYMSWHTMSAQADATPRDSDSYTNSCVSAPNLPLPHYPLAYSSACTTSDMSSCLQDNHLTIRVHLSPVHSTCMVGLNSL